MDSFGETEKALLVLEGLVQRAELESEYLARIKKEQDRNRIKANIKAEWKRLNIDRIVDDAAKAIWHLTGVLDTRSGDFSGTPVLFKEVVTTVPGLFGSIRVTLFSIVLFEDGIQILTRPGTLPFTSASDVPTPEIVEFPLSEVQSGKELREKLDHLLSGQIRAGRLAVDWRAREQRNTKGFRETRHLLSKPPQPDRGVPGVTVNELIKEALERKGPRRKRYPWDRYRF